MQLKFRTDSRTKVRFLTGKRALRAALARSSLKFLDAGAGISLPEPCYRLPAGEACKNWSELEKALLWLSDEKAERSTPLVAIGGGAALDLSALAASLYRRGMPLVMVPTTLLAMVDATLGGKTAVDGPGGLKNFAGTFYPASEVWIHPEFLSSLPHKERISGAGECWKTLWLAGKTEDRALVEFVRTGKVSKGLERLIRNCLRFKLRVVARDPLDTKRVREQLNFGHTIGHALEALAKGRLTHGECVLWGMAVETLLLESQGKKMAGRSVGVLRKLELELPPEFFLPASRWLELLARDKKVKGKKLELSLLRAPGQVVRKRISLNRLAEAPAEFRDFWEK